MNWKFATVFEFDLPKFYLYSGINMCIWINPGVNSVVIAIMQ